METFDAIIRLLQEQDTLMYKDANCNHRQCRHILPPSFVVFALANNAGEYDEMIKEAFIGGHLATNVEHCRMIMVPTSIGGHWSLYVWDLEEKRIHVLDPVLCRERRDSQAATHSIIIASLHEKLFEWLEEVLSGWEDDMSKYKIAFYNFTHQPATSADSAFYVAHYIRWFDGEKLTFAIDERKALNAKMSTFFDLMTMEGNRGWKPLYFSSDEQKRVGL